MNCRFCHNDLPEPDHDFIALYSYKNEVVGCCLSCAKLHKSELKMVGIQKQLVKA